MQQTMKPLWPHQKDGLHMLRQSLAEGNRRPVLQLPCGGGKTRLAAEIFSLSRAKGNAYGLFIAPRLSLINQTVRAFWAEGITDIGVLQGRHALTRPGAAVQVASVQTMPNRRLPPASVVIVDECHIKSAWLIRQLASPEWSRIPVIGLTATPWTAGMGKVWDDLIVAATMRDLIDAGRLSKYRLRWPGIRPDLSRVPKRVDAETGDMDYAKGAASAVMQDPKLVADAVHTYREQGRDPTGAYEYRPALCFGVDRAHAAKMCAAFNAAGVAAEYMDAYTDADERDAIGDRLRTGLTKVACNVGVASTGVDWPWVSCLIMARPTDSPSLWCQTAGRVMRLHPQGGDSLILDHTPTSREGPGLPDSIHFGTLDDGHISKSATRKGKGKNKQKPKECPSCGNVKPAGVHVCAHCGFGPQRQSYLEFAEGELVEAEISSGAMAKGDGTPQHERARWYAMLKWWGTSKGYKPMWINKSYEEKFGHPVGRDIDRGCRPLYPDDDVRRWIRSRQIAWGKAQQRSAAA